MKKIRLEEIGTNTLVKIGGVSDVPAKIDTGADSSAIWASDIKMRKDGTLEFKLFSEGSPFFTGKTIKRKEYRVGVVRSSNGDERVAYRTHFWVVINGRKIRASFNLSDRSNNNFPILIGRKTLKGKFLVNVQKSVVSQSKLKPRNRRTKSLNELCRKNPYRFHRRYIQGEGIKEIKLIEKKGVGK